jgi:hypothetical protein
VSLPKAQATASIEHGLDARTSVGVLARAMLIGDQRLTFVEGTVRRSIGAAIVEVSAARESNGGTAAHAQLLGKFGSVYVNVDALIANDFHLRGGDSQTYREGRLSVDAPVHLGKALMPAHAEAHMIDRADGSRMLDAAARLSANIDRFNLATEVRYHKDYAAVGASPAAQTTVGLIGSGHIGDVRIRGTADFDVGSLGRFRDAELSAYWTATEHGDWEGDISYNGTDHRALLRLTHILRLDPMAISLSVEAASNGDVAAGFNLNFSLDPRHGFTISRRPLAQGGMVHATVYRDLNDNGVLDAGEPLEKGALITTGNHQGERKTDAKGSVTIGGLTAYEPIAVGIDSTSLDDPMLTPHKALQVVVPRPGIPADVQIGLVGGGSVEGSLMKSGELGFEGVDLELVDAGGKIAGTTRTDFDGFFLFDRVAYGHYTIRVAASSAAAAKIATNLGVSLRVSTDHPVVRLGSVQAGVQPNMADAAAPLPKTSGLK